MVFTLYCRSSFEDASLATAIEATGHALARIDRRLASLRDRSGPLGCNWGGDAVNAGSIDASDDSEPELLEDDCD
jgi:hypothetical protein